MINLFIIRKWAALLFVGMFSAIGFAVGMIFYNFMIGLITLLVCLLVSVLGANLMLKNPFSDMLEGKGILVINLDSTGIMQFFNLSVQNPYIKGKFQGKEIQDVFNRDAVMQMIPPGKQQGVIMELDDDKNVYLKINRNEFNRGRFGFNQYPVLIYNAHLKTLLTKDFFSANEKTAFAEHGLLFLNRKVEDLTTVMRDFARYVVESTRPLKAWFEKKNTIIVIIVVILLIGVLAFMFGPRIMQALQGGGLGTIGQAIGTAGEATQTIRPINP
jgi:hypothetical protein